jgi:AcrR family transcriptional regulator
MQDKAEVVAVERARSSRRVKTRQRICSAARELFLAQGYAAATIEQIAVEAGVGRSTLYTHFSDKNEILGAIADDYLEELRVVIGRLPGPRPSRRQIDLWIDEFAGFVLREPAPTLLLISSSIAIDSPPAVRQFRATVMAAYARQLPVFAEAVTSDGSVAWARATAVLRELSWALVHHAEDGGGERAANMLSVAGDLLEQLVKGWF